MKRILILLAFLLMLAAPCSAKIKVTEAQISEALAHFRITSRESIIWERAFETELDSASIRSWFEEERGLREAGSSLTGKIINEIIYDKGLGIPDKLLPGVILYPCDIDYIVRIKDGFYKVVVTDVAWHPVMGVNLGLISMGVGQYALYNLAINGENYDWEFSRRTCYGVDALLANFFQP